MNKSKGISFLSYVIFVTTIFIVGIFHSSRGLAQVASSNMKWEPGHYILNALSRTETEKLLIDFKDIKSMKGLQRNYYWSKLETSKGLYDFKEIDDDLALVKKYGKKLSIIIGYKYQVSSTVSSLPKYILDLPKESVGSLLVPSYFVLGKLGDGPYNNGHHANFGHPGTLAGFSNLLKALAQKYDNDPDFVLIQFIETSLGADPGAAQVNNFMNGMMKMETAAKAAFAVTPIIQNLNYPREYLASFINNLTNNKMGFGGPDVFTGAFDDPDDGLTYDGKNQGIYHYNEDNFYISTGNNILPVSMQVHHENLLYETIDLRATKTARTVSAAQTVTDILNFAVNKLHSNYLVWQVFNSNDPYRSALKQKLLNEQSKSITGLGGLISACPGAFTSCGGTSSTPTPAPTPTPTPTPSPNDTMAPWLNITNPSDGDIIPAKQYSLAIRANATDNVGVTRMRLFINNNLKKTTYSGSLNFDWAVRRASAGYYTIKVEARDANNNVKIKSVRIKVNQ